MADVGTLDLIDYSIQVGRTGIVFVAALDGVYNRDGTVTFEPLQIEWATHRAASQLAWMGLIRGDTFRFMRESVPMSLADAATLVGYTQGDLTAWEAGAEVPFSAWVAMADYCLTLDHRAGVTQMPLQPDFRPRRIRITPNVPTLGVSVSSPDGCGGV